MVLGRGWSAEGVSEVDGSAGEVVQEGEEVREDRDADGEHTVGV
jgi:hypothetical protein